MGGEMEVAASPPSPSPADSPAEAIHSDYRPVSEERERASPSKYPTPLPDEEEDEQGEMLPIQRVYNDFEDNVPLVVAARVHEPAIAGAPAPSVERLHEHASETTPPPPALAIFAISPFSPIGFAFDRRGTARTCARPKCQHTPRPARSPPSHILRIAASTQAVTSATAYANSTYTAYGAYSASGASTAYSALYANSNTGGMGHGQGQGRERD
ncbi:hypothetical protein B0H19DRAFT_1253863 [Mycena capillaripes]|nr:hypothetical protein B0H19DRAFT_1253863 [Mycena capillaripes]